MDGDDHQILRINGVMPWFLFGFTPCLIPVLAIKVFSGVLFIFEKERERERERMCAQVWGAEENTDSEAGSRL